jgi:hypothetical protein
MRHSAAPQEGLAVVPGGKLTRRHGLLRHRKINPKGMVWKRGQYGLLQRLAVADAHL